MLLTVHVKPGARANRIVAWLDESTVKVEVTAAPEKGKANKAVINLLARELGTPPSKIEIVRGLTTRMKHVDVPDTLVNEIKKRL